VDEKVPHGNDIFPRDFFMVILKFRGDTISSFTDYLNMVEDPDLKEDLIRQTPLLIGGAFLRYDQLLL